MYIYLLQFIRVNQEQDTYNMWIGTFVAKSSLENWRMLYPLLYLSEGGPVPPPGGGGAGGRGVVGGGVDRGHAPSLPFSLQLLEGSIWNVIFLYPNILQFFYNILQLHWKLYCLVSSSLRHKVRHTPKFKCTFDSILKLKIDLGEDIKCKTALHSR